MEGEGGEPRDGGAAASTPVSKTGDAGSTPARPATSFMIRNTLYGFNPERWRSAARPFVLRGDVVNHHADEPLFAPHPKQVAFFEGDAPRIFPNYPPSGRPVEELPKHQRRQYGGRSVRQWFREMRAEEFAQAVDYLEFSILGGRWRNGVPWTLFDTQAVIERETAAHYSPEPDEFAYFVDASGLPTARELWNHSGRSGRYDIHREVIQLFAAHPGDYKVVRSRRCYAGRPAGTMWRVRRDRVMDPKAFTVIGTDDPGGRCKPEYWSLPRLEDHERLCDEPDREGGGILGGTGRW